MHHEQQLQSLQAATRREFFGAAGVSLGAIGLASLLGEGSRAGETNARATNPMAPLATHFAPRAKAVIYLFMAGGPSQLELFEDKPQLRALAGQKPPDSFMQGKRFAFLKGTETLLGPQQK